MPLEGNAEMIVWRQAVDTELRLANQWEDGMGFSRENPGQNGFFKSTDGKKWWLNHVFYPHDMGLKSDAMGFHQQKMVNNPFSWDMIW
jgi:hypothetical protein